MKYQKTLRWLLPLIGVLALFAAGMGLFYQNPGEAYTYTNHRGESVMINGQGLYTYDTVSMAAQAEGNDLVVLLIGIPLLAVSAWMAFQGSLRGRLVLTGTLGFFLYTYMSLAFLAAYNMLFLVYVAIFGLSLYAFIFSMMSFDLKSLPNRFSDKLPRRWIAGLLFLISGFLALAWLGRIIPPMLENSTPILENSTTLVIQAMDLALIVPLALISGISLLQRNAWGYLLSSVTLLKAGTLGLGVSAMAINMTLRGVPDSMGIMVPFLVITLLTLIMAGLLLKNIQSKPYIETSGSN